MPQRATEDRFQIKRPTTSHVCPKCGERCVARTLWVNAEIDCRCGTRMEAKEMDEQSSLEFVRSLSRSTHLGPIITAGLAKAVDTMKQEASKLRGAHDAMEALSKALTKTEQERDDLSKRLERMHRPRCDGYSDDPKGPWPLLENPCQFCGARSESDACRDMSDTADCDKIRAQRDVALAEVERLTKERVIFTARSRTVSMDEAREMFPDSDPKQQASG